MFYSTPSNRTIDGVAQAVQAQEVHLLDSRRARSAARRYEHLAAPSTSRHDAAVPAGQSDHAHLPFVRGVNRFDHVARVAAGRDREQQIIGLAQSARTCFANTWS